MKSLVKCSLCLIVMAIQCSSLPAGLIADFTAYSLVFNSFNDQTCEWRDNNVTQTILMKSIDRCTNSAYFPSLLSPNHVSWKTVHPPKPKRTPNATVTNRSNDVTYERTINQTEIQPVYEKTSENKTEIVYAYLAFAMILPEHPFSIDLVHSLRIVGAMYPVVDVVIGSGYEFEDMCAQFGIRSFPRLLLFTKGALLVIISSFG